MLGMQANKGAAHGSQTLVQQKALDFQTVNLQMFGYTNYKYLLQENGQDFFSKYDDLALCPQRCHERGFCMKKICYCKPGYIGEACGYDHYNWKKNDANTKDSKKAFMIWGGVAGGIGVILGSLFTYGTWRKPKDA